MTGHAAPAPQKVISTPAALDQAVAAVAEGKRAFARLSVDQRIALLRAVAPLVDAVSADWVAAACRAKAIPVDQPIAGEEWLAGPAPTARNVRLLIESLQQIARQGRPALGRRVRTRDDGRVEVEVLPAGGFDGILFQGLSCWVRLQPGIDEAAARQQQAAFYQQTAPEGRVALILGAGNVSSIPPMDVLYKMFVEGSVCILKMNPVNEWVGPFLERALAPLIEKNFLRIVYGGGEEGEYLCRHRDVDDIHITGSDKTHDRIVWGPPGPEQDRRKRQNAPLLSKPITSELGNVSPVAIVPGNFTDKELWFQARNLTTMLVNNASFNCNGAKVLITARGWPQRDRFLEMFRRSLGQARTRKAYYPGARQRYDDLIAGHADVQYFGQVDDSGDGDALRWAFIPNIDGYRADERLFRVEAFCGLLAHTEIGEADPAAFLSTVTSFCNDGRADHRSQERARSGHRRRPGSGHHRPALWHGGRQPVAGRRIRDRVAALGRPPQRHAGQHPERPRLGAQHVHAGRDRKVDRARPDGAGAQAGLVLRQPAVQRHRPPPGRLRVAPAAAVSAAAGLGGAARLRTDPGVLSGALFLHDRARRVADGRGAVGRRARAGLPQRRRAAELRQ